jgi:micrococcal nuclease
VLKSRHLQAQAVPHAVHLPVAPVVKKTDFFIMNRHIQAALSLINLKQLLIAIFITLSLLFSRPVSPHETLNIESNKEALKCVYKKVSHVIDGDTFKLSDGTIIRLIGVDTPETQDRRTDVQWFGREAKKKLREWVEGKAVCLLPDRDETNNIDKYGRLLRYVWKTDGFFVNAELIKQGYGFAYTRYPFQYMEKFRMYEKQARLGNLGLWNTQKQETWDREIKRNLSFAQTCGKEQTICPEDATRYIGQYKTVRFFVKKAYDSGKTIFLNSKNNFKDPDNFTAIISNDDKKNFPPDPEDFYWGKTVDVTGKITEYKGRAEIILKDIKQIRIVR